MEAIILTRELADKIVQMCKEILTEYKTVSFRRMHGEPEIWLDNLPDYKPDPVSFHWFELVITHLADRLIKRLNEYATGDENYKHPELHPVHNSGGEMLFFSRYEGTHIVDVLYSEFQKLKKWQQILKK